MGIQKLFCDLVKRICGYELPVPCVHCVSHNLNLLVNDAVGEIFSVRLKRYICFLVAA